MTIQFWNGEKNVKTKNLKIIPLRGDLVSFVKQEYFCVTSIEHHYESDVVIIRLDKV